MKSAFTFNVDIFTFNVDIFNNILMGSTEMQFSALKFIAGSFLNQ